MKIMKICLKNFKAVRKAVGTTELSIDFSNTVNRICLIIGPNGSGKTTLLSMLHPFADLGNLDIRNGNNLIIDNKEGYKEILIRKKEDIYTVKHFYTPHKNKNHSVKSYIAKNGVELNVNGNVTSFKEFVREELQIEPDYLKLIRLGSNVTSLIDLTSTERKNFMSKIMEDIGIFLEYYKSVNTKLRQLDEMISHTVDKEKRLGIIDKEEFEKEILELQKLIKKEEEDFLLENNKLTLLKNTINTIEDKEHLYSNLSQITKKYNKMTKILERKEQIESTEVSFYEEKLKELELQVIKNENEFRSNNALIQNSLEHLNTLQEQLRVYQIQLTKELDSDKEVERMEQNLISIRKRLREYEDIIGDFTPQFTKKELDEFIVFLKNTQQILGRTYEFGKLPIQRVIELVRNNKNVINYINSHLIDIDEKHNDTSSLFISTIANRFLFGKEDIVIDCKQECQAKTLYNQIQNLIRNSNVEDSNEDASFYHDMEFVYSNIISLLPRFSDYKELITVLPEDIKQDFTLESMYDNIANLQMIYNEKKINELMALTTEYDNYINLLSDYKSEELTLQKFSNLSNSSYLKEQIENIENDIEETRAKILKWKEKKLEIKEDTDECNRSVEVFSDIKETLERYDEVKELFKKYTKEYELFKTTSEEISNVEINITRMKINIDNLSAKLQQKQIDLSQYKSLHKDIKHMNKIYDEMTFVKEALSSKQGMPLHFISNYLKNTEEITNELLDIAYDGEIYIDSFDITPTEFSIPFYNKGERIADVKYASQGELSFLSVALAFALSSQALYKYNIMLLDEIDGPLDTKNREKFIRILENQIERIKAEQSFLITHNDMFSSYPVDILDFSGKKNKEQYPLANFIEIVTK